MTTTGHQSQRNWKGNYKWAWTWIVDDTVGIALSLAQTQPDSKWMDKNQDNNSSNREKNAAHTPFNNIVKL